MGLSLEWVLAKNINEGKTDTEQNKLDVHGSMHHSINYLEITNKM